MTPSVDYEIVDVAKQTSHADLMVDARFFRVGPAKHCLIKPVLQIDETYFRLIDTFKSLVIAHPFSLARVVPRFCIDLFDCIKLANE